MLKTLVDRLQKLLAVKSIMTLLMTGVFAYLSVKGVISEVQFMAVFTTVIGFYFGTQSERKKNSTEAGEAQ